MLVPYLSRYAKKRLISPPYESVLVKENTTLDNPNDHIFSSPNISSIGKEYILVLEEPINESFENPSFFSLSFTSLIRKDIYEQEETTICNNDDNITQQETIETYLHNTSTSLHSSPNIFPSCYNVVNDEDMLVLDNKIFNVYNNPVYVPSPRRILFLEDIKGQRNEIMDNHDNYICYSPICEEDT